MALTAPAHGPTGAVTPPLSTADVALFMGATADARMQQPLTAAIRWVERRCGAIVGGQETYSLTQSSGANRTIYPMWNMRALALPIAGRALKSVDALVDPYGNDVTASLTVADVSWLGAIIVCPYMRRGDWEVTATSARDAGDAEVLKEATLYIAKHLWEMRRGKGARPAPYGEDGTQVAATFAIPYKAQELLKDYYLMTAG